MAPLTWQTNRKTWFKKKQKRTTDTKHGILSPEGSALHFIAMVTIFKFAYEYSSPIAGKNIEPTSGKIRTARWSLQYFLHSCEGESLTKRIQFWTSFIMCRISDRVCDFAPTGLRSTSVTMNHIWVCRLSQGQRDEQKFENIPWKDSYEGT